MTLPPFGVDFLRDAMTHSESALFISRKNAKSAIIAVYLLGRLVGPLRTAGYRAGVVSIDREKASELWRQCSEIAVASGLEGLTFRKSIPRSIVGPSGTVDILSADASAGHASGFDDAIVDELGKMKERDRGLINGMRSSVSARGGRFIALSILGDSPFPREILERQHDPAVCVHLYKADDDAELDDPVQWEKGNPALGTIKSLKHMEDGSRRALLSPLDQNDFKAEELNIPVDPARQLIVAMTDWKKCIVPADDMPPRAGGCIIGLDVGGASSMTSAVILWPESGRLECYGAFGDDPPLHLRAQGDRIPYMEMLQAGELTMYTGQVTPATPFIYDLAARLQGETILAIGSDRYRDRETIQAIKRAGVNWPPVDFRPFGHGKDGSEAIRCFQRLVLAQPPRVRIQHPSMLLTSAIADSKITYNEQNFEGLDKARQVGRIDALSAAIVAAFLASPYIDQPDRPKLRSFTL